MISKVFPLFDTDEYWELLESKGNEGWDANSWEKKPGSLHFAVDDGDLEGVRKIMKETPQKNPGANENGALSYAIGNGDVEMTKLLLTDWRVNPNSTYLPWYELYEVYTKNQENIVKCVLTLMDDYRFYIDSFGFIFSAGDIKLFPVFLKYLELDAEEVNIFDCGEKLLSLNYADALCESAGWGNIKPIKILLEATDIDPSANNNKVIKTAKDNGNEKYIEEILPYVVDRMYRNICEEKNLYDYPKISRKMFYSNIIAEIPRSCFHNLDIDKYIGEFSLRRKVKVCHKIQQKRFNGKRYMTIRNYLQFLPNELMRDVYFFVIYPIVDELWADRI